MSAPTPRLRMFAGPNGSGKSTIKEVIPDEWLGIYINPDEIEKAIRRDGFLTLEDFSVATTGERLFAFLKASQLLAKANLLGEVDRLTLQEQRVVFGPVAVNSYWASVLSDFMRHQLLDAGISFTFETVMSSPDKVDFLGKARARGFRTYLYYVATEDPAINIERVRQRVASGGHPVAEDKIVSRYHGSLSLLLSAVECVDRAYLFDNSGHERLWVAEATDGRELEMKSEYMPEWFKTALWSRFDGIESDDPSSQLTGYQRE
jgi:predicted ABC-type ATPase